MRFCPGTWDEALSRHLDGVLPRHLDGVLTTLATMRGRR